LTLQALTLLHACSAPEHKVVIVFPDQQMMEATSSVTLAIHATDDTGACDRLRREQAVDGASKVLDQSQAFPFDADDAIGVGKLEDGAYAFVAAAYNSNAKPERFLTGCTAASVGLDDAVTVRVVLAQFRGCCGGGAGCSSSSTLTCYDGADKTQGVGECEAGSSTCTDGFFTSCAGQVLPAKETCNNKDDDCDGLVDEGVCAGADAAVDLLPPDSAMDSAPPDQGPDQTAPCSTDGEVECLPDGSARQCVGGLWQLLGSCPLGCSATEKACRVPSNVEADLMGKGTGEHATTAANPLTIDTDTGAIAGANTVIRPAGTGLDAASGIYFDTVAQGSGQPGLGVFVLKKLTVIADTTLEATGSRALAILASDTVTIDGIIDVSGAVQTAGPGGFAGGAPDGNGLGPGGGKGTTGSTYSHYCIGGGGGGGHGGAGGAGGTSTCAAPNNFAGGAGGSAGGNDTLVPLVGGSGGAGGVEPTGSTNSTPGSGGGGGGAIQIVATAIVVGAKGGINGGGGGGGESINAGGTGGGAGGAILLEAAVVTVAVGGVLAANGGGGGGGDCT